MLLYLYLLHYGLLLHVMSQYLRIFSLILQGLHEEGEWRQLELWVGKGANIRDLFCTTPKVLKLHESQFWNILKILGQESTRGGAPTVHEGGGHGRSLVISSHVNLVFIRYFDEMYVVFPLVVLCECRLVVLCERRLHDTSPLFGPRGRHWEVISR